MSWLFSRALVEEFLEVNYLAGGRFVPLKENLTVYEYFLRVSEMDCSPDSRYGAMSVPLTERLGEAVLTWFLAGSRARHTAAHLEDALWRTISGRKCGGSWQMSLPGTSLPRTPNDAQSTVRRTTSKRWVMPSDACRFPRETWVQTTFGSGTGFLHTPTHTANYASPSMQKWPNCREFVRVFGKPTPTNHEWLMGWPIGWSGWRPLGTDKFQQWRQSHFAVSHSNSTEEAA